MACYHFSLRKISRSCGSLTNAISYISASYLSDIYDGTCYDHRTKQYVDDTVILLPENAPEEWKDLQTVTNALNQSSNQPQAVLAREIELSLPIELPPEERQKIALQYIKDTFVDDGMVAIASFHSPKMNPEETDSYNPHVHIMLSAKPLGSDGEWISKTHKLYVCENSDGEAKLLSGEELKTETDFSKIFHYRGVDGTDSWHTKAYASEHPEECSELLSRSPKASMQKHPKIEKWASPDTLDRWREEWARIQNLAYEEVGLDVRVTHLSYKRQKLEMIPTVHMGKEVTALERQYKKEYDQAIANGEMVVQKHTDLFNLNVAIMEHNEETRIFMELRSLREYLEQLIAPVINRIEVLERSVAELLESLRAQIISLGVRIKKAVSEKWTVDENIIQKEQYVREITPTTETRLRELKHEQATLKTEMKKITFSTKKRVEISEKIGVIENQISVLKENLKLVTDMKKEICELKQTSEKVGNHIEGLKSEREEKIEEYQRLEADISHEKLVIDTERMKVRNTIESQYMGNTEFKKEAQIVDKKLGCAAPEPNSKLRLNFE